MATACTRPWPPGIVFVHFDFTLANLLTDGTAVTGVIDVNPPLLTGDRAFDLATLLYYLYDHDDTRHVLGTRLLDLSSWQVARAYLAIWCFARSTGRCVTIRTPRRPSITWTWPGLSS